jgi:hypothetical protein
LEQKAEHVTLDQFLINKKFFPLAPWEAAQKELKKNGLLSSTKT